MTEKAVCTEEPSRAGRLTFKWVCHNDRSTGGHAIKETAQSVSEFY